MTTLTPYQQAQRRAMTAELQRAIATHGIEPLPMPQMNRFDEQLRPISD